MGLQALIYMVMVVGVLGHFPTTWKLNRVSNHHMNLTHIINRDKTRLNLLVNFSVQGTWMYPIGMYYTKVELGSPPREFTVQIDTGSDLLWVSCTGCHTCPHSTGLNTSLNYFDPKTSSTASLISCSDHNCKMMQDDSYFSCDTHNKCSYSLRYGDESRASGFYVKDFLSLPNNINTSAQLIFGCSTSLTDDFWDQDTAIDGIFGFGQHDSSLMSQLAAQGIAPKVFSHCLYNDGGILVLGEAVEPNILYTPLLPSKSHYNLNLLSISVGAKTLEIDPSLFQLGGGSFIDSGTTNVYLHESIYGYFHLVIIGLVPPKAIFNDIFGHICFTLNFSIHDVFPPISFNFSDGAVLILHPEEYLKTMDPWGDDDGTWCLRIYNSTYATIFGEIALKNKIVVYDIAEQRVGWKNYNCSMPMNVTITPNVRRNCASWSSMNEFEKIILSLLLGIFIFIV